MQLFEKEQRRREKKACKGLGLEYTCMSVELPGMARRPCRLESRWGGLAALRLLCVRASGKMGRVPEEPRRNLGDSGSDSERYAKTLNSCCGV